MDVIDALPGIVVFAYLAIALGVGFVAGRRGGGGTSDFVAGERAFGPVVMYFVMGATVFSAFALLGTPQRVVSRGADVFYILAFGSVGFVPMFFFGPRVRRIGAREGYVTQAELLGARFQSRLVTTVMGIATVAAFIPYLVIQLKGAGIVMEAAVGWDRTVGAAVVYAVVVAYVVVGGMRGVGWTNVLQGVVMIVVVWILGLWIPRALYGGVAPMLDIVVATRPEYLTLPGPASHPTSLFKYSSEVLVSVLGFTMWPQVFMKSFTARSARLVQLSVVVEPIKKKFLVPLIFLGYAALLQPGAPQDETVLLWIVRLPELGAGPLAFSFVCFAVLAASMSTGDALLHGGGSIFVRDVLVVGFGARLEDRQQTRAMRVVIVVMGALGLLLLEATARISIVDLLLLAYAVPIQFVPLTLLGLYWRRANRAGAEWGLCSGLAAVILLFTLMQLAPERYAQLNPLGLQIGVIGLLLNLGVMIALSLALPSMAKSHLKRFIRAAD